MAWAVIVATRGDIAARLLPRAHLTADGADCTYYFYQTTRGAANNVAYTDPVDGEPLVAYHSFATLDAAKAWATSDAEQRRALLAADGRAQ